MNTRKILYKKGLLSRVNATSFAKTAPARPLGIRTFLALCCVLIFVSACQTHRVSGYEKYGEPINVLHYVSKDVLFSDELTNIVGLPPTDPFTLEEDKKGLNRSVENAPAGSPQYIRAQSQEHLTIDCFNGSLGEWFQVRNFPATSNLLQRVFDDTWVTAHRAKEIHFRRRPDPAITNSSYPSGHATEGAALATVLLWLDPKSATQVQALEDEIGSNRLVLRRHYPSDVRAGQRLGYWLVQRMRQTKEFRKEFAAAQKELQPYLNHTE